jgi:hypothetical protein
MTSLTRRELLKSSIAGATAAVVGLPVSQAVQAQVAAAEAGWQWDKGVCRMCGTGCGIQVATHNGRVVATKGDPAAPVNKGLNCIKGYFNGKMAYGADRLTQPLMRMKDGKFDKKGAFTPVSWKAAFDEMERQFRRHYESKGPNGVSFIGSGQHTIEEGYASVKLMKAGFRTNHIDPNSRLCMASAVAGFLQVFGADEPANVYDDRARGHDRAVRREPRGSAPGPLVAHHGPEAGAEGHARLQPDDVHEPLVGSLGHDDRDGAQRRSRDPELRRARDRQPQRRQLGLRQQALRVRDRCGGHRLRPARH